MEIEPQSGAEETLQKLLIRRLSAVFYFDDIFAAGNFDIGPVAPVVDGIRFTNFTVTEHQTNSSAIRCENTEA